MILCKKKGTLLAVLSVWMMGVQAGQSVTEVHDAVDNPADALNGTVSLARNLTRSLRQIWQPTPQLVSPTTGITPGGTVCPYGSQLQNGNCVQPVSYCSSGYNLVGNTCVGPSVCPPGYSLVNGQCIPQSPCGTCPPPPVLCNCAPGYMSLGNQCVKTETEPAKNYTTGNVRTVQATCPPGFDLNYEECLQHSEGEARCTVGVQRNNVCVVPSSCGASYQLDEYGRCIKNSSVEASCPPDSRLGDGGRCLYLPPQCPEGYTLERGFCIKKHFGPVQCDAGATLHSGACRVKQPSCPFEYRLSGRQCVKELRQTPSCPSGTQQRDGMCVTVLECPPNYQLINGACTLVKKEPATCPAGSRLVDDTCEIPVCPDGFTFRYMECVRIGERSATCPSGLQLVDGECVRTQPPSCEPGFTMTNNMCVRQEIGQYSCPAGSILRDGYCAVSKALCDSGSELRDGVCVRTVPPYCPTGSQYRDGNCVYPPECPTTYERKGDQCVAYEVINSTCPLGFTYRQGYCLALPQCRPGYTYKQSEGICSSTEVTPLSCPDGSFLENSLCVTRNLVCTEGYTMQLGQCRRRVVTSPVCPAGTSLYNGRCRARSDAVCRAGTLAANGMCEMQETVIAQCPAGYSFQNGQCVGMAPAPAPSPCQLYGGCQSPCANNMCGVPCTSGCGTQTTQPAQCPAGFNSIGNGYCTRRTTVPVSCSSGFLLEGGECVSYHSLVCPSNSVPEGNQCVRYENGQGQCPGGFTRSSDRCILINPPCPFGSRIQGGSCIKGIEVPGSCPPNIQKRNGFCVTTPSCPLSYSFHDGMCRKVTILYLTCPNGFQNRDNECIGRATCPPGFRFEQNQCVQTPGTTPTCPAPSRHVNDWCVVDGPLCEPGFQNKDNQCERIAIEKPVCPRDTPTLRNGLCESHHQPQCESGFSFAAGQCTMVEKVPRQCPQYFMISGDWCVSRKLICPPGYDLNGQECVYKHILTMTCSAGTKKRNDECTVEPVCEHGFRFVNGICIKETFIAPECPPDTTYYDGWCVKNTFCPLEYVLRDNHCEQVSQIPLSCTRGYLDKGDCVAVGPNCPQGYEFRWGRCHRRETVEPSCPPNARLHNNVCVVGRPECSGDYRYSNGRCAKVLRMRATCPGQAELQRGMCVWQEMSTRLYCDYGYTLQGSSCTRQLTLPCNVMVNNPTDGLFSTVDSSFDVPSSNTMESRSANLLPNTGPNSVPPVENDPFALFFQQDLSRARIDSSNVEWRNDYRPEYVPAPAGNPTYTVASVNTTESFIETQTEAYGLPSAVQHSPSVAAAIPRESFIESQTEAQPPRQQRCSVHGPRVCTTQDEQTWTCEQKQYNNIASPLCSSESTVIHLSVPSLISVNDKMFVMAPREYDEYEDYTDDSSSANCAECSDEFGDCPKYCDKYEECNNCEYTQLAVFCRGQETARVIRECSYLL